jgi:alpha-tubulin suppressor-like RCC1 family protein
MKHNIIRSCLAVVLVLGQLLSGVTLFPAPAALAALVPPACAPVCAWGSNQYAQLGTGTLINSSTPVPLTVVGSVVAIAGGQTHSLALKSDGTVWAWGYNIEGQLGNGTTSGAIATSATQVTGLTNVVAIAVGVQHSLALKNDGTVWAWGFNNHGQLGNGTTVHSTVPVQVPGLTGVVAIASGQYHSLALRAMARCGPGAGDSTVSWAMER